MSYYTPKIEHPKSIKTKFLEKETAKLPLRCAEKQAKTRACNVKPILQESSPLAQAVPQGSSKSPQNCTTRTLEPDVHCKVFFFFFFFF
jgi:hypothetical protein